MSIQEKIYRYFEQYPDLHVLFMFDPNNVHSMELMGAQWPENFLYETYDGCAFSTKCKMQQEMLPRQYGEFSIKLIGKFGRTGYYERRRGERLCSPADIEIVRNVLQGLGLPDLEFDSYLKQTNWCD